MRVLEVRNYGEMSALAAELIGAQVLLKPRCVLGLATGSSPIGTYERLVEAHRAGRLDFSQVRTVNLDEYCGLRGDDPNSYRYFMDHHLFSRVNLQRENTHLPNGAAPDLEEECRRYEALIQSLGGVDLQLLGIGRNGHIGFNEPSDSFPPVVHTVQLTESTIQANKRFFESRDEVPRHALSMGIKNIMNARRILMVVSGEEKADIVCKAFTGPVTKEVPASVLQLHPDVTLVGDKAALHKLVEAGVTVCG